MAYFCTYSTHHDPEHAQGHLFFDVPTDEPCTITLIPAASATQEWLDEKGEMIARAVNREVTRDDPRPITRGEVIHLLARKGEYTSGADVIEWLCQRLNISDEDTQAVEPNG